jgi:hypothetical protein
MKSNMFYKFLNDFSNASAWYWSGLNLVSYAVDEVAGLKHLTIYIL